MSEVTLGKITPSPSGFDGEFEIGDTFLVPTDYPGVLGEASVLAKSPKGHLFVQTTGPTETRAMWVNPDYFRSQVQDWLYRKQGAVEA
jgi:hypothetical protein